MTPYDVFVLIAAAVSAAAFLLSWLLSRRVGYARRFAPAVGSEAAGVRRAYKLTLAPWAREESRRHLPRELADTFYARSFLSLHYHLAIFAAIVLLLTTPMWHEIPVSISPIIATFLLFGLVCGLVLLAKRIFEPRLRRISIPDDYLANALASIFVLAAFIAVFVPEFEPAFQITGGVLLLYAPLGKIRHMLFTFTSLRFSGAHYGRRGVRPRPDGEIGIEQ